MLDWFDGQLPGDLKLSTVGFCVGLCVCVCVVLCLTVDCMCYMFIYIYNYIGHKI